MLNYAIRGHDLTTCNTIEEMAEQAAAQGIYSLQLALGISFPEWSGADKLNPGMGRFIKRKLAEKGVEVGLLSCYINMLHPDPIQRESLLQRFEAYLKYAHYFGASMVASETGCVLPEIYYTEKNFTEEAFEDLVSVIKRLVETGEKYQMMVGIEPGLNHPLYSVERVKQLLTAVKSDYLGIILDPTNLIHSGNDQEQVGIVKEAFESFGEKIVAVHLKDFEIQKDRIVPVNLGEGRINYLAILEIIEKYRPLSYVVLEETKDDGAARGLKLINERRQGIL
ncbi:sugar phosphate isomerase/epimerase [Enterococcus sp. BWT-B8]|uniref:sugar phosphate isomerase/epimerase family protein n=1 Tax=unclassified Enterococcus TaxID=2608891 RepID=UPI001E590BD4|nr:MULTISPECIES: sugar phosphate isomerase/epimerase [unclassified Enterococcus]MCB5953166.1 sugar phosphate isomerase/epimerase [Enterococcus sp. BWT-B8]MCB5953791.1 sugar phosphate isomerase/epimerase [Enterococcus sp. CWB-B31]